MPRSPEQLRRDVREIWLAGVAAVRAERLVEAALRLEGATLIVGDEPLDLASIGRIVVVGAGKAGAGMAAAVEAILGPRWLEAKQVGRLGQRARRLRPPLEPHPFARRAAGRSERAHRRRAAGAAEILRLVGALGPADLCLCLISGGGSALLPAPADGLTLDDKLAVTRHLSAAGANIEQLNTVRKQLSRIKGGGLAQACRGGRLVALIISDVLGDTLDLIASGPTVEDRSTPQRPSRC